MLGADLPLIGADVTVEHLLSHRSGIGDYLDEEADDAITEYVMPVPVHELATTEQYLAVLGGHPTAFPAGERFAYCNGGYVVLALIAERASGMPFHELVRERVCAPAGMSDTAFLRSDDLPGRAAVGYRHGRRRDDERPPPAGARKRRRRDLLDRGRHPRSLDGVLRRPDRVARPGSPRWCARAATCPRRGGATGSGSGCTPGGTRVMLEGYDAGVSFRSTHDPVTGTTRTVIANTSEGAWPIAALLGG